jgi:site-specific recombinase XerD
MAKSVFLNYIEETMYKAHYSKRTIETYMHFIKALIIYNNKRHPAELGDIEIESYLTYLALDRKVAVQTQKLALNSISYLYKQIF